MAGAVFAGACGGAGSKSTGTKPAHPGVVLTTPTSRPPSTTTTVPAYSFDDSVPPPRLINTGTDYVAILKSLSAYGNWLAAHHPDPALVANIVAPGTRQRELFSRDLQRLRANNKREVEVRGKPSNYTILNATSHAFSAEVVEDVLTQHTVLPTGQVTSEVRYARPTTYRMLAVAARGRWLFASIDIVSAYPVNP